MKLKKVKAHPNQADITSEEMTTINLHKISEVEAPVEVGAIMMTDVAVEAEAVAEMITKTNESTTKTTTINLIQIVMPISQETIHTNPTITMIMSMNKGLMIQLNRQTEMVLIDPTSGTMLHTTKVTVGNQAVEAVEDVEVENVVRVVEAEALIKTNRIKIINFCLKS